MLNIPKLRKNLPFNKITIILNGKSNLEFSSRENLYGYLNILHGPSYDESKSTSNTRKNWFNYLKHMFYPSSIHSNMKNIIYKEHLSIFCRVLHVEIHINTIINILEGKKISNETIEYLREDLSDNPETLTACYQKNSTASEYGLNECNIHLSKPELEMTPIDTEIYLIDLNTQVNSNEDLSFFIKDCEHKKVYYIILNFDKNYVSDSKRKVIFDHSNCNVKLFVSLNYF